MLRALCDYHIGENISEIRLDLPAYFDQLKQMGVGVLTMMTKDAMGTSYYDTQAGHRNRHVKEDIVAAAARLAQEHGITLIAYYNASLDDQLAAIHPQWKQVDAQGRSPIAFNHYTPYCMNTPYRDRVRSQLVELAGNQRIAGIWLDITYIFDGRCYCPQCKALFEKRHHYPMPDSPEKGSQAMFDLKAFRRDCRREYLEDFAQAVRAIRGPSFSVGWNHAGDIEFCQDQADRKASYFSVELHAPHYDLPFFQTAWMRPLAKPIELMMPECLAGWGEWTLLPEATFRIMGAIALAVGGELCMGHVPIPSGRDAGVLPQPIVEQVAGLDRWLQPRQDLARDTTPATSIAILCPAQEQYRETAVTGQWLDTPPQGVTGMHRMLLESHQPVDLLAEATLHRLDEYELAILPDVRYVSPQIIAQLKRFVEAGGCLVVDGDSASVDAHDKPLADFALGELTGTRWAQSSGLTARYFDGLHASIATGLPAMPLLVRSDKPMRDITVGDDCDVLATFTDPEYESTATKHVYHQHGHPALPTAHAAIVRRRVGKGQVIHIAAPLGADYHRHGAPAHRRLLANLLDMLRPDRLLRVDAPPSVRVMVRQGKGRWLIHLLHWQQTSVQGKSFVESDFPIAGVRLSLRSGERPLSVRQVADESTSLAFEHRADRVEIAAAPFRSHAMIEVNLPTRE